MSVIKHEASSNTAEATYSVDVVPASGGETTYEQWPQSFFEGFTMMKDAISKPIYVGE